MLQRGAARLLTGPFAFLLAGAIDLCVFSSEALARAARRRLGVSRRGDDGAP